MQVATKVQLSFSVSLNWDHAANAGVIQSGNRMPLIITPPVEFGGTETAWSPEHLLAASVASCYSTTFFYFTRFFKVKVTSFHLDLEMEIEKEDKGPFTATRFLLHPRIEFAEQVSRELIDSILDKTKKYCIISNSVKGEEIVQAEVS
jgi:organic hydroperoxide reductase OsmC/OhrA